MVGNFINIKDRLPNKEMEYYCYMPTMQTGRHRAFDIAKWERGEWWMQIYYTNKPGYEWGAIVDGIITHWMEIKE